MYSALICFMTKQASLIGEEVLSIPNRASRDYGGFHGLHLKG